MSAKLTKRNPRFFPVRFDGKRIDENWFISDKLDVISTGIF